MKKIIYLIMIILIIILLSIVLYFSYQKDVLIKNEITNIDFDSFNDSSIDIIEQKLLSSGLSTNTSKISIDFDDILNGGPGKDGIPAIDNPKFVNIKESRDSMDYLNDESQGISVEINGEAKFYPYNILVWHEIVNDTVGGKKISVTFCPLCGSAIVYDRIVDGVEVNFGVSGLLYQSNLLMYDDKTESLWYQSVGEAIVGDYLGTNLIYIKSNLMTLNDFESNYSSGKVLSDDTGYSRSYGFVPYGDYDDNDTLYFPVKNEDLRFSKKELFYIVNDGDESIAFLFKDLREEGSGEIKIGNNLYKATFKDGIIDVKKGNEIMKGYYEMWFSWVTHNVGNKNVWYIK